MTAFQVTPYVPGYARGILQRGTRAASASDICMLMQSELGDFEARPAGLIIIDGAPLSHQLIRLLALGVPTVLLSPAAADRLETGSEVLIDGTTGTIMQPPSLQAPPAPPPEPPQAGKALGLPDGSTIEFRASIGAIEEARRAVSQGAAAIGLVRTEFLAPDDGRQPDVSFYRDALGALCAAAHPLDVTLRLPDIRQDKPVPWLTPCARLNTPLGLQGVRMFDTEPVRSVIDAMLDAIKLLIDDFPIRLLLPYVTRLDEFLHWREVIRQRLGDAVPVGVMAESPIAVLAMPRWLEHADFVAIGCNDLMQCLFAADRDLVEMRDYLDPHSPELYRFLYMAADAAGDHIDRVQLCGLLPQQPDVLPVLIGMGFRSFSVAPVMIPYLARTAESSDLSRCAMLARQACTAADGNAITRA
jgi:phosphoenolpyruvate-protein kinase (PTS system EI component)